MLPFILHIDFDSYFASCEQQFDVSLRGKPIGVTATNGRTCIIAASREAKKFGVKNVTRVWEAKKICPQIITVPAHFEKYWEITQAFLDICKDYSPYVELFSLDEVFIDISLTENLFGGRLEIVRKIKERIKEEIGEYVTVSVGLSYNKLLAKLASGMNKPDGFVQIEEKDIEQIYSQVRLIDFCGIGERVAVRLNKIGIYTPLQLRAASLDTLILEFKDVEGHFLKNLGLGEDDSEVIPYYLPSETKSVGRNYCLPKNEYDQRLILQNVYELCEEVGIKLRRLNKKARTIGLYLNGANSFHGRKTLPDYIDSGQDIFGLCKLLYDEWDVVMVRQIGIWAGNLQNAENLTLSLFESSNKSSKIQKVMDEINDRFGDHTIRNGFVWDSPNLKTVPNGYMADRFERQKLVSSF
ncbi:MAG: polymerase IV protein [Microgenomates group bacterium GW2011_GWA2_37_6]|nr:MAG: polymerase IV protein [Microgenomates group bacterium GW2011_GWA2_37_6]